MDAEEDGSGTPPEGIQGNVPPVGQQTYPGVTPPVGEPPTMAQMFQLMQQQTALLMMQNQGGKGGFGKGDGGGGGFGKGKGYYGRGGGRGTGRSLQDHADYV